MILSLPLKPLDIEYPSVSKIPKNLLNSSVALDFKATSKLIPFREQFAQEEFPHTIKYIHYQYGTINRRRVVQFYYKKKPTRITYSNSVDPFAHILMTSLPPRVKLPVTTISSTIARSLREIALKWIVDQLFSQKGYITFDEPILDTVNPDCLSIPATQAHKILQMSQEISNKEKDSNDPRREIKLNNAIFVEIKAYHGSTFVGEKEVLQTFNYAMKGGKALLITSGTLSDLETFKILNDHEKENKSDQDIPKGFDVEIYSEFVKTVKKKNRKLIKKINFKTGQDAYDTKGIYLSAWKKLEKMHKYSINWPKTIKYTKLQTPDSILQFLKSPAKLGLIEPEAFHKLLKSLKLHKAAALFNQIRKRLIEEIMITPSILYPK